MSEVTITTNGVDDWLVWIQLHDGNPTNQGESFVIGSGETREAAVADAEADLKAVIARLQSPPTNIVTRNLYGHRLRESA